MNMKHQITLSHLIVLFVGGPLAGMLLASFLLTTVVK